MRIDEGLCYDVSIIENGALIMETVFTKENITLLISVLGACAWIPILIEKLRKPKIECKILKCDWLTNSMFQYPIPFEGGLQKQINGTFFIISMRLISRNNDFSIKDFRIKIKFCSMEKELDAHVCYSSRFTIKDDPKTPEYDMNMNENILYYPVLKKNEIADLETHFIVESKKYDVEYIKFIFVNTKNKEQIVKKKKEDFKYAFRVFG